MSKRAEPDEVNGSLMPFSYQAGLIAMTVIAYIMAPFVARHSAPLAFAIELGLVAITQLRAFHDRHLLKEQGLGGVSVLLILF
ncbi:MAG: hypothetical protein AAFO86_06800 [Pseudomonadota bacterium]